MRVPVKNSIPLTANAASVVRAHDRRRVLHPNVTEHPTAAWTAQLLVDTFPGDSAPSYLLRDRDGIFGQRVKGMGLCEVLTAP